MGGDIVLHSMLAYVWLKSIFLFSQKSFNRRESFTDTVKGEDNYES